MPELKERPKIIVLTEDPLKTVNLKLLEKIIELSWNHQFLNVVQRAPTWEGYLIPTNDSTQPLKKYLPGGEIIRVRYIVRDIINRYQKLKKI